MFICECTSKDMEIQVPSVMVSTCFLFENVTSSALPQSNELSNEHHEHNAGQPCNECLLMAISALKKWACENQNQFFYFILKNH